ncbi:MAG: hypothetical protein PHV59_10855 [Victivallales bacterium]|nr:hypothetical protein [Victivallales bacterium]
METPVFSANFKKDYIAYSAVVIFFLILALELFMAIFIPAHLHMEGVWSREVARQQMIDRFDGTRRWFLRFTSKDNNAQAEAEVIAASLTPLADYLRQYQYQLDFEEIKIIDDIVSELPKFRDHLAKKGAYSMDCRINSEKFMNILKKDLAETP